MFNVIPHQFTRKHGYSTSDDNLSREKPKLSLSNRFFFLVTEMCSNVDDRIKSDCGD